MLTGQPFLSVVIPTYNRRDSLRITLDGLVGQSYAPERFEVLVVCDGATDGTGEMVAEYARAVPYPLRLIRQANAGPARARNHGVRKAAGEVIVFIDDDVEPVPAFLDTHAAHHARDRAIVVIGPMNPDPRLRWLQTPWVAWEHAMLQKQYANFQAGVWEPTPHNFYTGNASVRREHLLAVCGFDEGFKRQEDVEVAYRMERAQGVRFLFDPRAAGVHRPARSFASWVRVPYEYGRLDVVRAQRGAASWDLLRNAYASRNPLTQALASLTLACPTAAIPLRAILLAGARLAFRRRRAALSQAALSVIYNLRYLEGMQAEIGSTGEVSRLLRQGHPPSCEATEKRANREA